MLREKRQLEAALKEIKTLTQVGFSHSICPDCFKVFHPGHDYPDGDKES